MTPRKYPVLDDENLFVQYLELAKEFNCKMLKMGGEPKKTKRCAQIAQKYGIKIGRNNHIGTEDKPGDMETIDRTINYLKKVNHPNFGVLYDCSHLFVSGSEYGPKAIDKIKDKIFYVLVQYPVETNEKESKMKFHGRYFSDGIFGEPNGPDFDKVFKGLAMIGYDGYIGVIQSIPQDYNPKKAAEIYYRRITNRLEKAYSP